MTAALAHRPGRDKLDNLQALRALAALMVVTDHVPRQEAKLFAHGLLAGVGAAGALGVDLFFVISGFIMTTTTWDAFAKRGASRDFLIRRILRVYPMWIVAVLFTLLVHRLSPAALHVDDPRLANAIPSLLLLPHGEPPVMFLGWSLEYEMFFYVVFALALCSTRARFPLAIAAWIVATLAFQAAGAVSGAWPLEFLGSPLCFEFLAGVGVAALVRTGRVGGAEAVLAIGVVGLLAVAAYSTRFEGFPGLRLAWFRTIASGPCMAAIVYGAVALETRGRFIAARPLIRLGDASYSMYLWHEYFVGALVVLTERLHPHGTTADLAFVVGAYAVTIVGSLVVYRAIERPLLRSLRRLGPLAPDRTVISGAPG